jgi:hypothetical protein
MAADDTEPKAKPEGEAPEDDTEGHSMLQNMGLSRQLAQAPRPREPGAGPQEGPSVGPARRKPAERTRAVPHRHRSFRVSWKVSR